jgi:hypothetical protein
MTNDLLLRCNASHFLKSYYNNYSIYSNHIILFLYDNSEIEIIIEKEEKSN